MALLDRRQFIAAASASSLAALLGGPVAFAGSGAVRTGTRAGTPLRILILGGTGFLGPHTIDAAKARGHSVTIFNRGRREKFVGARDGVEKLYGNRDPDKSAGVKFVDGKEVDDETTPKGLAELEGKTFDAVIDNSGYYPRHVKASAALLAPRVKQYVFISTLSVYASNERPGEDEAAPLGTIADPTIESMGAQSENYGPLKALCEQAAEAAMPGRVTNVRPGYIVGPLDTTDRFTYWPVRIDRGGEFICPGSAKDQVMFIDVRDLAEWLITLVENKTMGVMNATGPATKFTNGDLVAACQKVASKPGTPVWIPYDALTHLGCPPGMLPIMLPSEGELAGFHTRSVAKAVAAGLKFRPAEQTCKDLIEWWPKAVELRAKVGKEQIEQAEKEGRPAPRLPDPSRLRAGLPAEREAEILAEWKKMPTGGGAGGGAGGGGEPAKEEPKKGS